LLKLVGAWTPGPIDNDLRPNGRRNDDFAEQVMEQIKAANPRVKDERTTVANSWRRLTPIVRRGVQPRHPEAIRQPMRDLMESDAGPSPQAGPNA
jgi:hypothetical protein